MPVAMKFHSHAASQRNSAGWNSSPINRNSALPRRLQADPWATGDGTLSENGATSNEAAHNKFVGVLRPDVKEKHVGGAWRTPVEKEEWEHIYKAKRTGVRTNML